MKNACKILAKKFAERDHVRKLEVYWSITLKWIRIDMEVVGWN
jgi:hypothetical protein